LKEKFALTVPSSTENLALIREFVGSIAQQSGMDAADAENSNSPLTKPAPTSSNTLTDTTFPKKSSSAPNSTARRFRLMSKIRTRFRPQSVKQTNSTNSSTNVARAGLDAPDENFDGRSALRNRTGQKERTAYGQKIKEKIIIF
jgi:hypothetical protein